MQQQRPPPPPYGAGANTMSNYMQVPEASLCAVRTCARRHAARASHSGRISAGHSALLLLRVVGRAATRGPRCLPGGGDGGRTGGCARHRCVAAGMSVWSACAIGCRDTAVWGGHGCLTPHARALSRPSRPPPARSPRRHVPAATLHGRPRDSRERLGSRRERRRPGEDTSEQGVPPPRAPKLWCRARAHGVRWRLSAAAPVRSLSRLSAAVWVRSATHSARTHARTHAQTKASIFACGATEI